MCQLDAVHHELCIIDAAVAKALGVSGVAEMARAEMRLHKFLLAKWNRRVVKAAKAGASAARTKKASDVEVAVAKVMAGWAGEVAPELNRTSRFIYQKARRVGWDRATGKIKKPLTYSLSEVRKASSPFPGYDVVDEQAVEVLEGHNMFWAGAHYTANVSASIATAAKDTLVKQGVGLETAAALMEQRLLKELTKFHVPSGFKGDAQSYFEGLAANTATVARVNGQLRSFDKAGVQQYVVTNPMDDRTTPWCRHMNGKVFTVQQGLDQFEREMAAKSPDDIRKIHPWKSFDELKKVSGRSGEAGKADREALVKAGYQLPPYHFRCRTTIDIA